MFKVVGDIQKSINEDNSVALILLDSSAAFDTVDHAILIDRLEKTFQITGNALKWIKSYLTDRTFSIKLNKTVSNPKTLTYGVPQGSLLGPIFYILYTKEIETIVKQHGMQVHLYADDCQIYISFKSQYIKQAENKIKACLSNIKKWMDKSFLKLNPNKTNLIIINSKTDPHYRPTFNLKFNNCLVPPSEMVISLGVNISNNLDFSRFISKKVQICSYHLRNLTHIKKSLPLDTRIVLVTNLIFSTIDYCNSLLIGLTDKDLKPLQKIINKAVRFIFDLRKRDHISPFAFKAHFLPIGYRIKFKIGLIAFKIINGMSPDYLSEGFKMFQPTTLSNLRVGGVGQGRDSFMFDSPSIKFQTKSIFSELISFWNKLPYTIRTSETLAILKTRLKTHLFKKAYPNLINHP